MAMDVATQTQQLGPSLCILSQKHSVGNIDHRRVTVIATKRQPTSYRDSIPFSCISSLLLHEKAVNMKCFTTKIGIPIGRGEKEAALLESEQCLQGSKRRRRRRAMEKRSSVCFFGVQNVGLEASVSGSVSDEVPGSSQSENPAVEGMTYSSESHSIDSNGGDQVKSDEDSFLADGCGFARERDTDLFPSLESGETSRETTVAGNLVFDHKVALDVAAPSDLVWDLWTDLKNAPLWMRWIDRVELLTEDKNCQPSQELPLGLCSLSRWICSTAGFEVMWVARVESAENAPPRRVLRWATVEGYHSTGRVTFTENSTKGTTVELSVSHSLPVALGRLMASHAIRALVQATLESDLVRFQKYAAEAVVSKASWQQNKHP